MYQLFCDSNCELWYTTVKELGLNVIRMPYTLAGQEYFYDMGEKTDLTAFFDAMKGGEVPKTSALNEEIYIEYFEPVLKKGEDIFYVTFSHAMSKTFDAMDRAIKTLKEKYPDREIRTVDTRSISMGCGFVVYYAALKYKEGATMDELEAYVKELSAHTATYFAVEDLTYLYRGGRVSGLSKVFGNLLNIKPVLHFDDEGRIVNIAKEKGVRRALSSMIGYMKAKGQDVDKYKIVVIHADYKEVAERFVENIKAEYPAADVVLQYVGPVIGAHCGPGTVGLIFHCSER